MKKVKDLMIEKKEAVARGDYKKAKMIQYQINLIMEKAVQKGMKPCSKN